jgi:hypothetical protein
VIGSTKGNGFSQHQLGGIALLTGITKLDLSTPPPPITPILYSRRNLLANSVVLGEGDTTDGDVIDEDTTDGDVIDEDATDGDVVDEDATDGDVVDGDMTDGDVVDGDVTDRDVVDGDVTDGDVVDGDVTDGNMVDGDITDGDVVDGDVDGDSIDLAGREKFLAIPGCRSYIRPLDVLRICFGASRRDSKFSAFPISCGSRFGISHASITPCVCGSVPSSLTLSRLFSPCSSGT